MIKTNLEITTNHLLALGAVVAVGFVVWRVKGAASSAIDSINPASDKNIVYKAVKAVVGDEDLSSAGDRFFGAIDLINPFNESDKYAEQVWGLRSE